MVLFRSGTARAAPVASTTAAAGADLPFAFTLEVNGTRDLRFLPAAEETTRRADVDLAASELRRAPPLPETRRIDAAGFTARWRVPDFGRPIPRAGPAAT